MRTLLRLDYTRRARVVPPVTIFRGASLVSKLVVNSLAPHSHPHSYTLALTLSGPQAVPRQRDYNRETQKKELLKCAICDRTLVVLPVTSAQKKIYYFFLTKMEGFASKPLGAPRTQKS